MTDQVVLIADAGEVIKILIFLFIVGDSLIGKLMNAQPRNKPNQPGPKPPQPRGRPQAANAPQQANLEKEIEQFLQRARRRGQQPQAGPPQPRPEPILAEALPADIVAAEHDLSSGVSSHVQHHLRENTLGDRVAHLGDAVDHADEKVEDRLHDVFDHDLGRLKKKATGRDQEVSEGTDAAVWQDETPALNAELFQRDLVDMLRSPQDVRKVVVLSEIIGRPDQRWD